MIINFMIIIITIIIIIIIIIIENANEQYKGFK